MGRIYAGLLLAALCGTGCGKMKEPGARGSIERHKDGSRLKARVITTSDGLRWFQRIHDSRKQMDCSWAKVAPDGAYYCVDDSVHSLDAAPGSLGTYFTDAHCTHSLVYFFNRAPGPNAIVEMPDDTCDELLRFHFVGARWGKAYYRRNPHGVCVQEELNAASLYQVGPALVPGDHFVRGTLREKQSGKGIKAYVIAGEDGSETFRTLHDTTHDTDCIIDRARDGTFRCLPSSAAWGRFDATSVDPACTERVFTEFNRPACPRPPFARQLNLDKACTPSVKVFAVKEEVTQVYAPASETDPTCRPAPPAPPNTRYYRIGAELPAATWPQAKEVDLKVHGRLIVRGMELAGAVRIPDELFDTRLGTWCTFRTDPSGTERCFPSRHGLGLQLGYFADATCTTRVAPVSPEPCSPGGYALSTDPIDVPRPRSRAYTVGPKHEGRIYALSEDGPNAGTCAEVERSSPLPLYGVGAELEATSLVQGTETLN
ncbi:hypothetical protein [Myxococcus stipitatus]|uniref:DUF7481 family protein n=1 Tax=Myxococcus stipitatus TaxID=83455 RepID=UPI0030D550A0